MKHPLNPDLSQEAFAKGVEDAKAGKAKSGYSLLRQPKAWLLGNVAQNSWTEAYNKGFDWQLAKNHGIFTNEPETPTSTGEHIMSRPTSFAYQIELLQHLKSYLHEFQERLAGVSANYQRKIDSLHQEGCMMDETYRDYVENQLNPTCYRIRQLIDHLDGNDIPAVERAIAHLEQGL